MDRINVTKSSMPGFDEYMEELRPVWDSRWLSNRGAASKKFEEELKKYLGVEHVYCFANGHVALEVAIDGLVSSERRRSYHNSIYTYFDNTCNCQKWISSRICGCGT